MGHFVYFKDYSRLLKSSYGLTYPKINVFGVDYEHTTNWTDIKNEAKVCCFQYMLLKIYEPNVKLDDFIYDWVISYMIGLDRLIYWMGLCTYRLKMLI